MTLIIEEEVVVNLDFDYKKVANDVVNATLDYLDFPYESEISLTITDEETIKNINSEFRNIDRATDVLSFPMVEYEEAGEFDFIEEFDDLFNPESGEVILGDIVLCLPKVFSQAEEFGHSVLREYAFLIAHSMLHLLGFDHMTEEEASVMFEKQDIILNILDIKRN
ncbi:MAG: rRNA maturation RNase YbeY [Enterococcus sp.]|nr:rRNA maturation RNase YbeY [Enterococcus sp.]